MEEKFEDIIKSDRPVLVDFFATWCGPCRLQHPVLEDLHRQMGDKVRILTVDIDKNRQLAADYNVRSVPTLMIFKGGEIKWRSSGLHQIPELVAAINEHS